MKGVNPENKVRLLIVDDHVVVREGLQAMLRSDLGIAQIATASCGAEAVGVCVHFQPHVVLLDLRMPGTDGFGTLETILQRWPRTRVLILSVSATGAEVKLARRNGAAGYLSKSADRATLLQSIHTIAAGGTSFPIESSAAPSDGPQLSARELEVLRHLGRGLSSQDLGRALGVSEHTIKSHLKAIFSKLGVVDRAEAVAKGYELGLLSTER